jgi:hypothetical protein
VALAVRRRSGDTAVVYPGLDFSHRWLRTALSLRNDIDRSVHWSSAEAYRSAARPPSVGARRNNGRGKFEKALKDQGSQGTSATPGVRPSEAVEMLDRR